MRGLLGRPTITRAWGRHSARSVPQNVLMSGVGFWVLIACLGGIILLALLATTCWWAYRRLHDEYNRQA